MTLSDYRRQVLKLKQAEIAAAGQCDQSWVSAVENGFLPARCTRTFESLVRAYGLNGQEDQFVRMVQNAKRLRALRRHVADDFPLELFAQREEIGLIVQIPTAELLKMAAPTAEEIELERKLA